MLSPQAFMRGLVQRALPPYNPDSINNDVGSRYGAYGESYVLSMVRKQHLLADEGSYFVATNNQTAIVPTYGTSLVATSPFITIYNSNTVARLYLDYIALVAVVAGAQTTTAGYTAISVVTDSINRFTSGGSSLTANIVNPNQAAAATSGAIINCGAIVAPAASAARTIVGLRNIRPSVSTTVINVVGDMNLLTFGSVEGATGSIVIGNANIMPQALPPVIIGPGQSVLLYIWYPVVSAPSAATYAPEIGFWVR
jgi:hypothetical protein